MNNQSSIVDVTPYIKKNILLLSDEGFYGKILSESQSVPLKINIEVRKGIETTMILLSQTSEMPTQRNCDKAFKLDKANNEILYYGKKGTKEFSSKHIYFAIKPSNNADITFTCSFGKYEKKKHEIQSTHINRRQHALTSHDIEMLIMKIKDSPFELYKLKTKAANIIKKRKMRSFQLSSQIDIIKNNKKCTNSKFVGCLKRKTITDPEYYRQENAKSLREKTENQTLFSKFLSVHKSGITKIAV